MLLSKINPVADVESTYYFKKLSIEEVRLISDNFQTPIKRYTKQELASLYNHSVKTLMRWINQNHILVEELKNVGGYRRCMKEFRKEHVRLIFAYLGEP